MSFDPEQFGKAMGEAIQRAVAPLRDEIEFLKAQLASIDRTPGKDGKDGADGKDGKSFTVDEAQPLIDQAVALIRENAEKAIEKAVAAIPVPKDGRDGIDGKDGKDGEKGEKGEDGTGMADLLIDRDGVLIATYTDGRMKSLGQVVGKDGKDGVDGKDGIGLDSFEIEYLPDTHEISIKAQAGIRTKEVRYPAGGIQGKGYWREGTKAAGGEAWVHDGSLWVAKADTTEKPSTQSETWFLAARKGRDGERGAKGKDATPVKPIDLSGGGDAGND